MQDAAN
jgi:Reverse transcriptase (RNA-dependent DNA polymerase)